MKTDAYKNLRIAPCFRKGLFLLGLALLVVFNTSIAQNVYKFGGVV